LIVACALCVVTQVLGKAGAITRAMVVVWAPLQLLSFVGLLGAARKVDFESDIVKADMLMASAAKSTKHGDAAGTRLPLM
jgi:hypothetical protein